MNNNLNIFSINETAIIHFQADNPKAQFLDLHSCDEIYIIIQAPTGKFTVEYDCLHYIINFFKAFLQEALEQKLYIHSSIKQHIGYLWNEILQDKPSIAHAIIEKNNKWVGKENLLWSTRADMRPSLDTWLYNDVDGNIIMEITPCYPWHFSDPESGEEFIEYEEFMKLYKTYFKAIISPETARQWIEQIDQLIAIFKANEKKLMNLKSEEHWGRKR